jgi:threonine synthase
MPTGAPAVTRAECVASGAELYLVDGLISDAGKLISAAVASRPGYQDTSTLKEPYRLEGKALMEMRELGWVHGGLPRLVAVQASGCAPIVRAFDAGARESEPWPDARTVAFGITVPKALGDFLILDAIYATRGIAVAVDDDTLLAAQREAARLEGTFVCPEGAACFTAIGQLRKADWLAEDDRVVALNTGTGLKYPGTIQAEYPY